METEKSLKPEMDVTVPATKDQKLVPSWVVVAIILLGIGYIFLSLSGMVVLSNYDRYHRLFQNNDHEVMVLFRYLASWSARLLGLAAGVGFFFRRDFFRRTAIFLAWWTIAAVFWSHTQEVFVPYVQAGNLSVLNDWVVVKFRVVISALWESKSALVVMFILTRPLVRSAFR